jgi:hypothetical protein
MLLSSSDILRIRNLGFSEDFFIVKKNGNRQLKTCQRDASFITVSDVPSTIIGLSFRRCFVTSSMMSTQPRPESEVVAAYGEAG